jgi:thioredoxin family protein
VRLAYQLAVESDLIRADAIEATEFPNLAGKYLVYAVPKTVINGSVFIEGSLPEEFFLNEVLKAVETAEGGNTTSSSSQ